MKTTFEIEYTDDLVEFDEQWNLMSSGMMKV